jgi:hypothetical protein
MRPERFRRRDPLESIEPGLQASQRDTRLVQVLRIVAADYSRLVRLAGD